MTSNLHPTEILLAAKSSNQQNLGSGLKNWRLRCGLNCSLEL